MDGDEGKKMVRASRPTNISDIEGSDDIDEEPGEVIESAPPLKVGEEREINASGLILILKKKLLKSGHGWGTPELCDEVTVHYVGTALDGSKITSGRDKGEPFTFKVGNGSDVKPSKRGTTVESITLIAFGFYCAGCRLLWITFFILITDICGC